MWRGWLRGFWPPPAIGCDPYTRPARACCVGRPFAVTGSSGEVVLRGRLRRASGGARPWRHAALADLSALRKPGSYRGRVGRLAAPRAWVISPSGRASSRAIRHVLRFFAVTADGTEASPAHGPSHLNDATVRGGPLNGQRSTSPAGGWTPATRSSSPRRPPTRWPRRSRRGSSPTGTARARCQVGKPERRSPRARHAGNGFGGAGGGRPRTPRSGAVHWHGRARLPILVLGRWMFRPALRVGRPSATRWATTLGRRRRGRRTARRSSPGPP